ncbi:MAG: hypothetical protein WC225_01510 [Acholeplasmataceae bacterium]|nr:hypothetical protein [Acholeplasmataceae bacterium]
MKKMLAMLMLLGGALIMSNEVYQKYSMELPRLVSDVEFDTKFDFEDFEKEVTISRKYSDDIGLPEDIGL